MSNKRVTYYYDYNFGKYFYGEGHLMQPKRVLMTHELVLNYGLYKNMNIFRPRPASAEQMMVYHTKEYIDFLKKINPYNICDYLSEKKKFFPDEFDNPVFDGLFDYCRISAGGSLASAAKLNKKDSDIVINWSGGLHHAKKANASGFCYVNDIVLAILELLKYHQRVLYIDIDIHHGDGVQEAFYSTDRVMTLSFHCYAKKYFPYTGKIEEVGEVNGKNYSINVPLHYGMNDYSYQYVFEPIVSIVVKVYQPSVIVLQCGADSLSGDPIGTFNLTVEGHGNCVKFVKKFNIPLMLLGGGGYSMANVARCWTYETAIALGLVITNEIPPNDYFSFYGPDYKLHTVSSFKFDNKNSFQYLNSLIINSHQALFGQAHAPSVQMQTIPDSINFDEETHEENEEFEMKNRKRKRRMYRIVKNDGLKIKLISIS